MIFDALAEHRHFARVGMLAAEGEVERLAELLGRPPRAYEAYVSEVVEKWRKETIAT
jgi:hypothetical protein